MKYDTVYSLPTGLEEIAEQIAKWKGMSKLIVLEEIVRIRAIPQRYVKRRLRVSSREAEARLESLLEMSRQLREEGWAREELMDFFTSLRRARIAQYREACKLLAHGEGPRGRKALGVSIPNVAKVCGYNRRRVLHDLAAEKTNLASLALSLGLTCSNPHETAAEWREKDVLDGVYIPPQPDREEALALGLIWSRGHVYVESDHWEKREPFYFRLYFCSRSPEEIRREMLEIPAEIVEKAYNYSPYHGLSLWCSFLDIYPTAICTHLFQLGFPKRKGEEKRVPDSLLDRDEKIVQEFTRGVLNFGLRVERKRVKIKDASQTYLQSLHPLLSSLGLKARLRRRSIEFPPSEGSKLLPYIFYPPTLEKLEQILKQ